MSIDKSVGELMPCPHCGNEYLAVWPVGHGGFIKYESVYCDACGALTPLAAWNRRAALQSAKPAVEPVAYHHFARKKPELRELSFNPRPTPEQKANGWITRPLGYIDTAQPDQTARIAELESENVSAYLQVSDGLAKMQDLKEQLEEARWQLAAEKERADSAWKNTNIIEKDRQRLQSELDEWRFTNRVDELGRHADKMSEECAELRRQLAEAEVKNAAAADEAYDMVDRFLRNNLDDDAYADYSSALDSACGAERCALDKAQALVAVFRDTLLDIASPDRFSSHGDPAVLRNHARSVLMENKDTELTALSAAIAAAVEPYKRDAGRLRDALVDLLEAADEAWSKDRPCSVMARAALAKKGDAE